MKILWNSVAPFVGTGYGQQTALFAPRIQALGHDLAISSIYGVNGGLLEWEGLRIYPNDHTNFNKAILPYYAAHHAGDDCDPRDVQVITLQDVFKLTDPRLAELRLASWCPVDHYPVPPPVIEYFNTTGARPIAMSRFGEDALDECGLDPLYVPHGVDTSVFRPTPDTRADIRAAMNIPDDAFVVGMVANNAGAAPSRKAFPQVMQAFSIFRKRHPEAILYLHTEIFGNMPGINLIALADITGLSWEHAIRTTDQLTYHFGLPPAAVAAIYNAMDVLANPSYGEGFGVPLIEAQACGVPVIATDWTAMPELVGAGWLVQGDHYYDASQWAFWMAPAVDQIVQAFEHAYDARDDQTLKAQAREFALRYDADKVTADHWVPVLDTLDRPREVPPLNGNRAQRRANAKAAA